jgi:N-acetylglucosaminyldiphosphoundecaprenol N-acetyl-beta-D-mannosaminyltransferase
MTAETKPGPVAPSSEAPGSAIRSHSMLGMRLDYLDWQAGVAEIIRRASIGGSAYICVPDVNECVLCHDNPEHRAIVNGADLVLTDSIVLQRTRALFHRAAAPKTIKGADLMAELCKAAADRGVPVSLVGGRDDRVLARLRHALERRFPTLRVVHAFSLPFRPLSEDEDDALVAAIAESGAKLVFVGLGCPKQERWMARHKGRIDATMIGLGAAFDFLSGAVKPSPPWVHRHGLEWLYRLAREPKRLWRRYLLTCPRLFWLMLAHRPRSGSVIVPS